MKLKKIKTQALSDVQVDLDAFIESALHQASPKDILVSMANAIQKNPLWDGWRGVVHHDIKELALKFGAKEEDFNAYWVTK